MYITSTGMVSPVGLSAEASCAAMRAGIANFVELPYVDNSGEPIIGAFVPTVSFEMKRDERLLLMLEKAIAECISKCDNLNLTQVPLFVCLAEEGRPGGGAGLSSTLISQIENRLDTQFHPHYSKVICNGHTSGFEAIVCARNLMNEHGIHQSLMCGVDSYINANSLLWLEQQWRLKTEDNSDGVIPGEAAAAVLISVTRDNESKTTASVTGLGFGHEKTNVLSDEPLLGIGLADAARSALAESGIQMHEIDFRISDVTGENYGFKEQTLSLARLMRNRRDEFPIWHCAEFIGDSGATAGICQIVMASEAFKKGYAPGNHGVCYTSAISGDRAVAVLETTTALIVESREKG